VARRLFTFCSALSLVLCAGVCVLWARSQFRADHGVYRSRVGARAYSGFWLRTYTGYTALTVDRYEFPPAGRNAFVAGAMGGKSESLLDWAVLRYGDGGPYDPPWLHRAGWNFGLPKFHRYADPRRNVWDIEGLKLVTRTAVIPFWLPALAASALPAVWVRRRLRQRRRTRRGLCSACGYDLRASPGRCPECGGGNISTVEATQ
jgi:hypothetical protein